MSIELQVGWRQFAVALAVTAGAAVLVGWWSSPARSQGTGPAEVDTFAFVARADNPVDALAASSAAGQLGAPVYLTFPDSLDEQAAEGLKDANPQVVVLAGGTAALSEAVEQQIAELLPDAQIRRFAGAGRTETAKLANELTGELGVDRPVLAGATVAGDVGIDGTLTVAGTDIASALQTLTARIDTLEGRIDALEGDMTTADGRIDTLEGALATANGRIDTLEADLATANGRIDTLEGDLATANGRIDALESTFAGVSRTGDLLTFSGMNVQVTSGSGATGGTINGLGNLIVGYNTDNESGSLKGDNSDDIRTGSHNLIVGDDHTYSSYGAIVAGYDNATTAPSTSVTGGVTNIAAGSFASVSGGFDNTASGYSASVTGGINNTASSYFTSVSGGFLNTASFHSASVSGGRENTASDFQASVSGGYRNSAGGDYSTVGGGANRSVTGDYDWRAGGLFEDS